MLKRFDFCAQPPDLCRRFGHRLKFGILLGRSDKAIAFKLPRSHPRLKLGKARFNLGNTVRGDFQGASDLRKFISGLLVSSPEKP